jgi:hypothetical protein
LQVVFEKNQSCFDVIEGVFFDHKKAFFEKKQRKSIKNLKNISKSFAICSILCYNREDIKEFFRNAPPSGGKDGFF